MTILHELGHALGLEHPVPYNTGDVAPFLTENANTKYSVMVKYDAKFGGWWTPSKPMLYDILAIQTLYGVNPIAPKDDGDKYYFQTGADAVQAIWDAGGDDDAIDASDQSDRVTIDLTPGHFSFVGDSEESSQSQIAIAYQVAGQGDNWIENAIGSSNDDHLYGNDGDNTLEGREGNDYLEGGKGDDTLIGGDGIDIYVIEGHDIIDDTGRNYIFYQEKLVSGVFIDDGSGTTFIADDGRQLSFHSPGRLTLGTEDSITFQNQTDKDAFTNKDFGIYLDDMPETSSIRTGNEPVDIWIEWGGEGYAEDSSSPPNTYVLPGYVIRYEGLSGSDLIATGLAENLVYAGAGNDMVYGRGGGKDYLFGEAGNDFIQIGDPDPYNDGGHHGHYIVPTDNRAYVDGGAGDDVITVVRHYSIVAIALDGPVAGNAMKKHGVRRSMESGLALKH